MRRLRDEPSLDPALERASRLLASIPPIAPSKRRRDEARIAIEFFPARRRTAPRFQLAVALAIILLGGAAVAGATLGRRWIAHHFTTLPVPKVEAAPTALRRFPADRAAVASPSEPTPTTPLPPLHVARSSNERSIVGRVLPERMSPVATGPGAPPDEVTDPSEPASQPRIAGTVTGSPPSTSPVIEIPVGEGAELLIEAMRAIRHGGDGVRGAARLDEYLERYPNGRLVEEALAIGIEADAAQAHGGRQTYATEYLRRFPSGRFTDLANSAIATGSP